MLRTRTKVHLKESVQSSNRRSLKTHCYRNIVEDEASLLRGKKLLIQDFPTTHCWESGMPQSLLTAFPNLRLSPETLRVARPLEAKTVVDLAPLTRVYVQLEYLETRFGPQLLSAFRQNLLDLLGATGCHNLSRFGRIWQS
jgi:hypothetical protein